MKAADEDLENLLKAWGRCYFERPRVEDYQRRSRLSHPIAQSMQFAPGKTVRHVTRALVGRGGYDRRKIMGKAAGVGMVPMSFVDPVRCKSTNEGGGAGTWPVHPEIQRVEHAVKALEELRLLRGLCVRVNYCTEGKHDDKAAAVTERMREVNHDFTGLSVAAFRDELLYARIWLAGRLSFQPIPALERS